MIPYPYDRTDWVNCGCCGAHVRNTPEHNVALHQEPGTPYPNDDGYGMCKPCGGDPDVELPEGDPLPSEALLRKRMGWAACVFFEARIELVANSLKEENRDEFTALSFAQKVVIVRTMLDKGVIKW